MRFPEADSDAKVPIYLKLLWETQFTLRRSHVLSVSFSEILCRMVSIRTPTKEAADDRPPDRITEVTAALKLVLNTIFKEQNDENHTTTARVTGPAATSEQGDEKWT